MLQEIHVNAPIRDGVPLVRPTPHNFSPQQLALLDTWKSNRKEWNVHLVDNPSVGTEMIVVELPPYLDIDGLGLNLPQLGDLPAGCRPGSGTVLGRSGEPLQHAAPRLEGYRLPARGEILTPVCHIAFGLLTRAVLPTHEASTGLS